MLGAVLAGRRRTTMQRTRWWLILMVIVAAGVAGFAHAGAAFQAPPTPSPLRVVVTSEAGAHLRSGPGTDYPIIDTVDEGTSLTVLAYVNGAEAWFLVEWDGGTAWIAARLTRGVALDQVTPAATIPPLSSAVAGSTPEPTAMRTPPPTLPPGANAWIDGEDRARLRSGPGLNYPQLDGLEPRTPLRLIAHYTRLKYSEAEPDNTWYLVQTVDGRYGWVYSELVATLLPIPENPPREPRSPVSPDAVDIAPPPEIVLPDGVLRSARIVYRLGQQLGNHPDRFIIIGDSTSAGNEYTLPAFCAFKWGSYDLGRYEVLQRTIDYFDQSFCASNLTLRSGFSTSHILDPIWADPSRCNTGETPLECEYRRQKPAAAIIYIGLVDITYDTLEDYAANLDVILTFLIEHGVIPVLNTIPSSDHVAAARDYTGRLDDLNAIIRDAATRYRLPLIELQGALHDLPNQGCIEEGFHLSYRVDGVINFTGDELIYGKDRRELLTLLMLHALRLHVIEGEG
jgi:uncharacterized protein YraI